MGNKHSTPERTYIDQFKSIDENDLELLNIDKLQTKVIKELIDKVEALEREKQTKMLYAIPKVDLCNWSLFYFNDNITKNYH